MRNTAAAAMAVGIRASSSALVGDAAVSISTGWIPAAPPTSHAIVRFMTIDSVGADPVRVIGATSPAFSRINFHESKLEDGVMRMRALPELRITGGEQLVLQPCGVRLMLTRIIHEGFGRKADQD